MSYIPAARVMQSGDVCQLPENFQPLQEHTPAAVPLTQQGSIPMAIHRGQFSLKVKKFEKKKMSRNGFPQPPSPGGVKKSEKELKTN